MKKLSTKWFKKWANKVKLNNEDLLDAVNALESGLSTANLGGNLFKVRVKRKHSGKRAGFRTIIVFKSDVQAVFLFGFEKNEKENINKNELKYFKKLGYDILSLNSKELEKAMSKKILFDLEA
jgi:hypothetical protein